MCVHECTILVMQSFPYWHACTLVLHVFLKVNKFLVKSRTVTVQGSSQHVCETRVSIAIASVKELIVDIL